MTRGTASLIGEVNELRAMKRRLKKLIKEYEELAGLDIEEVPWTSAAVYAQLLEVLNGKEVPKWS